MFHVKHFLEKRKDGNVVESVVSNLGNYLPYIVVVRGIIVLLLLILVIVLCRAVSTLENK